MAAILDIIKFWPEAGVENFASGQKSTIYTFNFVQTKNWRLFKKWMIQLIFDTLALDYNRIFTITTLRTLLLSSKISIVRPRANLKNDGERAFDFAAADVWNSLPDSLREVDTLAIFKKQLKTHLFKLYFNC